MKKPVVTEVIDHSAQKRALRINTAKLAVKRADNEIRIAPNARATVLVRDLRGIINDLIEELEYSG